MVFGCLVCGGLGVLYLLCSLGFVLCLVLLVW